MKFYHVAHPSYEIGDDLLCREALETERGIVHPWKWDADEGIDGDVVCLFREHADAEEMIAVYLPAGRLLVVDLPDDAIETGEIRLVQVDEGYDAVAWKIPAEYISITE